MVAERMWIRSAPLHRRITIWTVCLWLGIAAGGAGCSGSVARLRDHMAVDSSSGMEKMRMLIESRRGGGGGEGGGGGGGGGGEGGIPKVFESSTGGGDTGIVGGALAVKEMVMQGKRIHAKGKRMELCLTRECESEEGVVGEEEPGSLTRASSNSNDKNKRDENENNDKVFGELGAPDLGVAVAASDSGCDGLIDSPPGWDGDEWIGRPSSNTTWLLKFELLLLYKQKHGMCKFPATLKKATLRKIEHEWDRQLAKEGVEALGSWLAQQKFAKKVGKLSEDRIRLLSGTGALMNRKEEVVAEKKRMAGSWSARFAEVLLVKQHRGNVQVSQRLKDPGHLVKWCSQQRWLVQMGGLPTEREDALRRAGFDWDMQDSYWGDMLMELAWYRLRHGTTNVPFTTPRQPPPTPPGGEGAGGGGFGGVPRLHRGHCEEGLQGERSGSLGEQPERASKKAGAVCSPYTPAALFWLPVSIS